MQCHNIVFYGSIKFSPQTHSTFFDGKLLMSWKNVVGKSWYKVVNYCVSNVQHFYLLLPVAAWVVFRKTRKEKISYNARARTIMQYK